MAKFVNKDLRLKNNQKITFGDGLNVDVLFDGSEFGVNSTVSGVDPTQDYHLTTKQYVDGAVSSIVTDHGGLTGLSDDDHPQYTLADGTRAFTGEVLGITPTTASGLATKGYVDGGDSSTLSSANSYADGVASTAESNANTYTDISIATLSGSMITDHGALTGLDDDDHPQYILANGNRSFTGVVGGITPTASNHLTTKDYVDSAIMGLDWQESIIDMTVVASGTTTSGSRYIASATDGGWTEDYIYEYNGSSWDEVIPNEGAAVWVENLDALYTYNGSDWVIFGSTVTHNNLSGLQGGNATERYHLTSAQASGLTGGGDTTLHTHDGRYYTESETDTLISTLSGTLQSEIDGKSDIGHSHTSGDITDFSEAAQDAVGNIISGVGSVTVSYNDSLGTITISGTDDQPSDHGVLTGLSDDDHTQYILATGSRAFTGEVVGVYPTASGSLSTKQYVDDTVGAITPIYEHGRQSIADAASTVSVVFGTALPNTNYTISCVMENLSDSPPSIYAHIVYAKATTGFSVAFIGEMDSANYILNWSVIAD